MTFIVILLAAVTAVPSHALADLMVFKIDKPTDLPAGLTIESKRRDDGMIQFVVYINTDTVVNSELYKGRTRSNAHLNLATDREQIASVALQPSPERGTNRTWYQFSVAPSAINTSEFQLSVSLFEADGMPTLGGGRIMQIKLAGFQPKANTDTKPAAAEQNSTR
jgi:hypothetical protein